MAIVDARISTGLPSHPKTKKLIRRLGDGAAWRLVCLFLWTAANRPNGDFSGLTDEDIELAIDWGGDPGAFIAAMLEVRFMDGEEGSRSVHNWHEHNPWAATADARSEAGKKAASARWAKRGWVQDASETHAKPVQNARSSSVDRMRIASENDSEHMQAVCESHESAMQVAPIGNAPSPTPTPTPKEQRAKTLVQRSAARFEEFWAAYPVKKGKPEAEAKWRARNLDAIADRIIADVQARKAGDRQWLDGYVPHGSTYVSKRVWEDEIEPTRDARSNGLSNQFPGML